MRFRVGGIAGAVLTLSLAAASSVFGQTAAAQAATVCKDGTTSATSGRGACSNHGGVDTKASAKAAKPAAKVEKTADKPADKSVAKSEKTTDKSVSQATKSTDKSVAKADKSVDKSADKSVAKSEKAPDKSVSAAPKTKTSSTTKGDNNDPTDATAQCKDGTYSHAKNHQGACSNHGGVSKFLK